MRALDDARSARARLEWPARAVLAVVLLLGSSLPVHGQIAAPVLKWQRGGCLSWGCQTGWYAPPAVADLDGDGQAEVIGGSYDVVSLNGATGSLEWRAPGTYRVWPGVAVADLTGDGTLEVIVGGSSGRLTVYGRLGNVLWTADPFAGGEVRTLAVDDLENDGQLEIVVGRASGGATRQLSVYEPNGSVRPGWPARRDGEPGYGWGMYNENVAVADMNGDGFKEIFGPTDTHYITALDRGGNQLPASAIYGTGKVWSQVGVHVDHAVDLRGYANCGVEHRPNFADSAPIVADVNADGTPEMVVVGNVYNCGTDPYTSLYHMPFILKLDRTRWSGSGFDWTAIPSPGPGSGPRSEDYNVIQTAVPNPVAADLDGDGRLEVLFPSYDGKLHAYWLDKTEHGSWPYTVPGSGIRFAGEPAVADLDGDGHAEVLFTSWPENGGGRVGQLHVLDYLGNPLHVIDLPAPFGGSCTIPFHVANTLRSGASAIFRMYNPNNGRHYYTASAGERRPPLHRQRRREERHPGRVPGHLGPAHQPGIRRALRRAKPAHPVSVRVTEARSIAAPAGPNDPARDANASLRRAAGRP